MVVFPLFDAYATAVFFDIEIFSSIAFVGAVYDRA
jgi:hypothetical protein